MITFAIGLGIGCLIGMGFMAVVTFSRSRDE